MGAAKAEAKRKVTDIEQQLASERQIRASAEAERDRLRGEVLRLKNELEEALTSPGTQPVEFEPQFAWGQDKCHNVRALTVKAAR